MTKPQPLPELGFRHVWARITGFTPARLGVGCVCAVSRSLVVQNDPWAISLWNFFYMAAGPIRLLVNEWGPCSG